MKKGVGLPEIDRMDNGTVWLWTGIVLQEEGKMAPKGIQRPSGPLPQFQQVLGICWQPWEGGNPTEPRGGTTPQSHAGDATIPVDLEGETLSQEGLFLSLEI